MKPNKIRPGGTTGIWGKQGFGGYPGVKHTAKQIIEYVPIKFFYVEPFAGLGRTAKFIKSERMVLNDKGDYAFNYLKRHFPQALVTQCDFMECIDIYDSPNTVFFIDPPWSTNVYTENVLTFCDRKDIEYYYQLFNRFHSMKADWILSSKAEGRIASLMKDAVGLNHWHILEVQSEKKVIMGKRARTLLLSNKTFIKHIAFTVGMDGFM